MKQDAASVTIQEMLKVLKVPGASDPSRVPVTGEEGEIGIFDKLIVGSNLWDLLPASTKEIFVPFLNSKFENTLSM